MRVPGRLVAAVCLLPAFLSPVAPHSPAVATGTPAPDLPRAQWGEWQTRNMVSAARGLPDRFDPETGLNTRWTADLGTQTFSSPIAYRGHVLIGTNNARPRDSRRRGDCGVLMCLDASNGRLAWQLVVPKVGGSPYNDWPDTGLVSPATVEDDRVYLLTNRNEVACLDLNRLVGANSGPYLEEARHATPAGNAPIPRGPLDADIRWLTDIVKECGTHRHDAAHGSVLADGPLLWINTSNGVDDRHMVTPSPNASSLIALEKATGRIVARDDLRLGPMSIHNQWASPSVGEVDGRRLVFYGGGDGACYAFETPALPPAGAAPAALKCAWRFDCDPTAPKTDIFRYQDNRAEGPSNITAMPVFHEGRVYVLAGGDLWHGKPKTRLYCLDPTGHGDITRNGAVWSYAIPSYVTATPALRDGLLYVTDTRGTVHCLDAATGAAVWTHALEQEVWGSPLLADGKLYVGTRAGTVFVLAAGRQKRVFSSVRLDSAISGSPCASDGVLYIATMKRLYAFGSK